MNAVYNINLPPFTIIRSYTIAFCLILICLLQAPKLCAATAFGFTNAGMAVSKYWVDDGDFDFNATQVGAAGSLAVSDSIFLVAGLSRGNIEDEVDTSSYYFGAGGNTHISDNTQLVVVVQWSDVEWDVYSEGFKIGGDGLVLDLALKRQVDQNLELVAGIEFNAVGDDDTLGFILAVETLISDDWTTGLNAYIDDDTMGLSISLNKYF